MTQSSVPAALLLTAAGSSSRFASSAPAPGKKEYLSIGGLPVLFLAMRSFLHIPDIVSITVTVPGGDEERARSLLSGTDGFSELLGERELQIVPGGTTRQASVLAGLAAMETLKSPPELVLIHDGARPWATAELIRRVIAGCGQTGAAVPVIPSTSAMKERGADGTIVRHLVREATVEAQTPQGFRFGPILAAHRAVEGDGRLYIDDAEVFAAVCGPVLTVEGDPANRKITYGSDLQ